MYIFYRKILFFPFTKQREKFKKQKQNKMSGSDTLKNI